MRSKHYLGGVVVFSLITVTGTKSHAAGPPFLYGLEGYDVVAYAADGTSTTVGGGLETDAIAIDPSGTLYASWDDGGYVAKYAANGSTSIFAGPYYATDGLASDTAGNIYVAQTYGENNIYKITPGGSSSLFAHLSQAPYALAFDFAGNLYASMDSSIEKISPDGVQTTFVTGLSAPRGIVFDPAGDVYVANDLMVNGNVQEYNPSGTLIRTVDSGLPTPYSVALDNTGDVFIGELAGLNAIVEVTPGGNVSNFATYTYGGGALLIAPAFAPSVPEPTSLAVLGVAGAAAMLRRRRSLKACCH